MNEVNPLFGRILGAYMTPGPSEAHAVRQAERRVEEQAAEADRDEAAHIAEYRTQVRKARAVLEMMPPPECVAEHHAEIVGLLDEADNACGAVGDNDKDERRA